MSPTESLSADIVFVKGKVVTLDRLSGVVDAVATKGDRIIGVGSTEDVRALAGSKTTVVDLKGRTVLPGINDAHIHLASWGATRPPVSMDVGHPTVHSIADVVAALREQTKTSEPGEWVRGFGWNESYLAECSREEGRRPTRWDLDPVSPENPVLLADFSGGHILWVNSRALELAGIDRNTPNPPGGTIIRDPQTGEPTGLLDESSATQLVSRLLPPLTLAQKRQAILSAMKELSSLGVTSITEPGLGHAVLGAPATDGEVMRLYSELQNEEALSIRVNVLLMFSDLFEGGRTDLATLRDYLRHISFTSGFGSDWLRIGGLKLYADSMPLNKTSWMNEEYVGGGNGHLLIAGETDEERCRELFAVIDFASRHRFQLGVHSTGDRATDACVGGFVRTLSAEPWDARHYIIHGDFVSPAAMRMLAENRLGVCLQSLVKWTVADAEEAMVGQARSADAWPFRSLVDGGVHVANSSDAPICYPDWRRGLQVALTRESKGSGRVSGPHERVTREQALRSATLEGAWLEHADDRKGSIEVGKLADLCVLEQDILAMDENDIPDAAVALTVAGGEIVFSSGGELL